MDFEFAISFACHTFFYSAALKSIAQYYTFLNSLTYIWFLFKFIAMVMSLRIHILWLDRKFS